ncbi:non-ribosomal peptide synthetase [Shimazuella kribbensis]|uniref:non-ribosomal peptide synthetase n=1 Tax=Shimazuella kribbensis TaxID=139808 RepID=UPI00041E3E50|nr:non-ribosomal peptide synthetase [Shimazuella kribbensis]
MLQEGIQDVYPLTPAQQGILFHSLDESLSGVYVNQLCLQLNGSIDLDRFEKAWQQIVQRHEVFRTAFFWEELTTPLQVVKMEGNIPFVLIDWSHLSADCQEKEWSQLLHRDRKLGFDLQDAPLTRITMVKITEKQYRLLWSFHHLLLDGWSCPVVLKDLLALYEGEGSLLSAPVFSEYVAWLETEDTQEASVFWRKHLESLTEPTILPIKKQVDGPYQLEPTEHDLIFSKEQTARIREVAKQLNITESTLLLGIWLLTVSLYTSKTDVVVGMAVSGRSPLIEEYEHRVGMHMNTVPVHAVLSHSSTIQSWLQELQKEQLEMKMYERMPLAEIQACSQVPSGNDLFNSLFVYENYPTEALVHKDFSLSIGKSIEKSHYPLTLMVLPSEEIRCRWIFEASLMDSTQVTKMGTHYQYLLQQVLADPWKSLDRLEWTTMEEKQKILSGNQWEIPVSIPTEQMHQLLEKQAEESPEKTALIWGNDSVTYQELNDRANQLARLLLEKGLKVGDFIAVGMPRSIDMVVSFYAIWKIGAAYVPIDLSYPEARLTYILKDSQVRLLITKSTSFSSLPDYEGESLFLDQIKQSLATLSTINLNMEGSRESLAYIIYTSGSTGQPKGVMISHRSAVHLVKWASTVFTPEERNGVLASTSICFDLSVFELFFPLSYGGVVIGVEDALGLVDLDRKDQVTLINTVPSAITQLLDLGAIPSTVKTINLAGESLTNQLAQSIYDLGHVEKVYNLYGPSEDTTYSTYSLVQKGSIHAPAIGQPIAGTEAYVMNEQGNLLPMGFPGELYLGGVGISKGYLNRSLLTAEKFVEHPFRSEEKLYRTGDLVVLQENGEFIFLGRMDHQVKVRGYRIELAEIEHVLEKHVMVTKSLVVATDDQLIAYVTSHDKGMDYADYVREFLPTYMIPNHFIELDSFPLTPNGKIDRKALPDAVDKSISSLPLSNDSPLEEILKGIWQGVLGKEVNNSDNFFALGGHSLLATQVISRIARIFQVVMPIRSLFQSPTVKLLARDLDQMLHISKEDSKSIKKYDQAGKIPLSPSQKRVWFLEQILPLKHVYHLPFVLKVEGPLQNQGLKHAVDRLVMRHAALRTSFHEEEGIPYQMIAENRTVSVEEMDLRSAEDPEREARLQIEREIEVPFALESAPLIRVKRYQLSDDKCYLFFLMHHLIADGWSLSILQRELFQFYESKWMDVEVDVPDLSLDPTDYAFHLEEQAKSKGWEKKVDYWKEKLEDVTPIILPTDFPRPNEQTYEGNTVYHLLPIPLADELNAVSREYGSTLYMVLLSSFQVLLSRYTGQTDIAVGSPVAGRDNEQLEGLIGFFVETMVIRTDISKSETWEDLLHQVREISLEAYANSQVPFEKVVDAVSPDRKLSESPLFQIMFAMQSVSNEKEYKENLVIQPIPVPLPSAKFDLTLTAVEQSNGIFLTFEYNRNLFSPETMERMIANYEYILDQMVQDLEQNYHMLSLLSEKEVKLLASWSKTEENIHSDFEPLPDQILAQVQMVPEGLAVVEDQKTLSYLELDQQSTQLALFLRSIGVGKHDRVAICANRCSELVIALLGVMKLGACYVPLDPTYPLERLAYMFEDSGASVLLTENHLTERLAGLATTTFVLDKHPVSWDHMPTSAAFSPIEENQLAYMVYTSGSTGVPKGVCITHGGLHNLVNWHQQTYELTIEDRTTMLAGPAFDASAWEIWPTLAAGGTLVIPNEEKKTDPTELRDWLIRQGITISFIPTPLLAQLLSIPWSNGGSLRHILTGGDQLHVYPSHDFPIPIINHYGPTENTVVATAGLVPTEGPWSPSIGKPISGVQVYVLDEQGMQVPIGIPGELCIGGNQLAARYHQQPDKTKHSFIHHPLFGRLYKTGDRVRLMSDGNLHFQGRMDRQVSIRGYRVELGEIEATLIQLDHVREAVVMILENNLVAYVVTENDYDVPLLRDELMEKLPSYMIPKLFIALSSFPLTANGKLDRSNLPEPNWDQLVDEDNFVAPRTKVECQLAEIWRQLLHIDQISVHDNFFQLGGDSIISIQMVARAKSAGVAITAKQVFSHQTISELATVAKVVEHTNHDQGLIFGEVPLTPIQKWFFDQKMENLHHFNQAMLLSLSHPLSISILTNALEKLIEHHDGFRLRFVETEKGWRQSYSTISNSVPLQILDISSMTDLEQIEAIKQVGQRAQTSLHLQEGPLFRAIYFKHGFGKQDKLLMVIHHLIIDGVSWRILLEDLSLAYQQLATGKESILPAKTTSYQAWSNILLKSSQTEAWSDEIEFWKQQQASPDELPPIFDTASENREQDAGHISFRLPVDETKLLLTQSYQAYRARVTELLLAALIRSYHAWAGNDAVTIDLEGHGREESFGVGTDLSRTVGWFTSIYPIRFQMDGEDWDILVPKVQDLISRVPKQGISYGMLKHLNRLDLAASSPISFNYLGQFQDDPTSIWDSSTSEGIGTLVDPTLRRPYALDIWSIIQDEQLEVKFIYDPVQFSKVQITSWITLYQQQLNLLIQHCVKKKPQPMLVDFPLAKLEKEELLQVPSLQDVKSIYLLSPLQEGMLFHSLYEANEQAYVIQMTMDITGELDTRLFAEAWDHLVERHSQLSISLWWKGVKIPHQIAWKQMNIPIYHENWIGFNKEEQDQFLADYLTKDSKKAFDLDKPPLMRLGVFSIKENKHQVVWSYHHVILDGWSMPVVLEEFLQIYQLLLDQRSVQLPTISSYEVYFQWLQEQDEELAKSYWSHQLADAKPAEIAISTTSGISTHGEWITYLSEEITEDIKRFAKSQKVTMNTVIQAAWGIFLAAYSGQSDLVYGTTVSGRPGSLSGVEQIVGPFINTIPVRIDLSKDMQMEQYLTSLQQQLKDTEEYSYVPLTKIADWAGIGIEEPLFHYLLVMENYQMRDFKNATLQISNLKGLEKSHYPLVLVVAPGETLFFKWMYDNSKFDKKMIVRFMRLFTQLLKQFIQSSSTSVANLDLLLEEEKAQLNNWHHSKEIAYPLSTLERIVAHSMNCPDQIAIQSKDGEWTYGELYQNASQLAYYLGMSDVKTGDCVGVLLDRSIDLVTSVMAIHLIGAAYVPIDPAYPEDRIKWMIQDADLDVVITNSLLQTKCAATKKHLICMDKDKWKWSSMPAIHTRSGLPQHLAYVVYTSGSSGTPKGVEITQQSLQQLVDWHQSTYSITSEDKCSMLAGVGFDASVWEIWPTLASGATLCIVEEEERLSPARLRDWLIRSKITVSFVPTVLCEAFFQLDWTGETIPRLLLTGGDQLRQYPPATFPIKVVNHYGPSENTVVAIAGTVTEGNKNDLPSIGSPIAGTKIAVVNHFGQKLPIGVSGELWLAGTSLARGYRNRQDLTEEKFSNDIQLGRIYQTGDIVRYGTDGQLFFMGRKDDQIQLRGFRVELGEIETVLLEHPDVTQVVVLYKEQDNNEKVLLAFVQAEKDTQSDWKTLIKQKLPDYMHPAGYKWLSDFPVTPNGKLDKKALLELEMDIQSSYVAPSTPMEQRLVSIWVEVLGIDGQIGVEDNFFQLGGHSLMATQVITRINELYRCQLPLRVLFECPTIAELVKLIKQNLLRKASVRKG